MLDGLYFGKDDAESDIGRGGLLVKSFLETPQYKDALQGKKWLVLGRKGKSAICLKLKIDMPNKVSLVTPDLISAEEIKRFELSGIASYQAKELLWRYIFCVEIGKLLLRDFKLITKKTKQLTSVQSAVRKFLIESGEAEEESGIEKFWKLIEKIKLSLKITPVKAVELSGEIQLSSGIQIHERINEIEQLLVRFRRLMDGNKNVGSYYILVDQVERIWSNDPGSDALVIGLLVAAKHAQGLYDFAYIITFLRIDIYEKLTFPERDKLRSDELHIRWDSGDLISLIERRAVASTGDEKSSAALWESVFPKRVAEQDVKKFLASRTLNRPRDIIQFANACRDVAKAKGRDRITVWDIFSATSQYSRWKLIDIENEWSVNFPFLADTLLLVSNSSYMFDRKDFLTKYKLIERRFYDEIYVGVKLNVK